MNTCQVRMLRGDDEAAFLALLRSAYGESYAYRSLYQPGGLGALIASGRASLWGDFSAEGALLSHTGFFHKDPRGDYVESGMSFRSAAARQGTPDAECWRIMLSWLRDRCALIHQNTSTWHVLAQRYAERYMRARPTGVIVDYVRGERLVGIAHPASPMQALTMTTVLRPEQMPPPTVTRLLPPGPWGAWLRGIFEAFGVTSFDEAAPSKHASYTLDRVEWNHPIGLSRRALTLYEGGASLPAQLAIERAATDLVHLPCDARMRAFEALEEAGYVPVGVRPHATRADEVILQWLPGARRREAIESLASARLGARGRVVVAGWIEACTRTS